MTDWTSAEMMRKIEDLMRSVDKLMTTLETGYVRRDTHESSVRAVEAMHLAGIRLIEARMESDRSAAERAAAENAQDIKDVRAESKVGFKEMKAEQERNLAWKRQVTAIGISALLGMVVTFAVAIFNLLTGG